MIRIATSADAPALAAIYAPIVRDTAISFEADPPDAAEMARRIEATLATHPWLVAEEAGAVVGYVYAGSHAERAAYRWSANTTAYVAETARGRGVGKTLYTALIGILRRQGFRSLFAGITAPNRASVALHESVGFEPLGVYRRVGFKLGAWHDVGYWRLALDDTDTPPEEPLLFAAVGPAMGTPLQLFPHAGGGRGPNA